MQAVQKVAPGPGRRRLILAVAGLVCAGVAGFALWRLADFAGPHSSATSGDRQVTATVRGSASCQGTDTEDTVSFRVDGGVHQAKLNGCGHFVGETVNVLVPAGFDGNTVLAQADAAPGDSAGLSHRVAFLLLIVATAVGGACGYGLFRTRRAGPLTEAPATPRKPANRRAAKLTRTLGRRDGDEGTGGRVAVAGVSESDDRDPRDNGPAGVDWFEDSSTNLSVDLGEPADRS